MSTKLEEFSAAVTSLENVSAVVPITPPSFAGQNHLESAFAVPSFTDTVHPVNSFHVSASTALVSGVLAPLYIHIPLSACAVWNVNNNLSDIAKVVPSCIAPGVANTTLVVAATLADLYLYKELKLSINAFTCNKLGACVSNVAVATLFTLLLPALITSSSTIQLNFILQLTELLTINYQKI